MWEAVAGQSSLALTEVARLLHPYGDQSSDVTSLGREWAWVKQLSAADLIPGAADS